jgi:uncharacterized protein YjbJ (UPF0337 family)
MNKKTKAKNVAQIAKGKVEEIAGGATGDKGLEMKGRADQSLGHLKQAGQHLKAAVKK